MIPLFKVNMSDKAHEEVAKVLASGYIGQGAKVEAFEKMLRDYLGFWVLTVSGCTHGLDLAYHLIGIKRGDKVISTPMTCIATNTPLVVRGAKIIWADVNPHTGSIDPNDVELLLSKHEKVKAVVICDWTGRECDEKRLIEISKKFNVPIVEDAAHSFAPKTVRPNDIPWYTVYSFGPIKHLTCGDGGAIIVPDYEYERAKLLRWYGLDRTRVDQFRCGQDLPEIGMKYHMNDIAATIGISNFEKGKEAVELARANAQYYERKVKARNIELPLPDPLASWWLYSIKTPKRFEFIVWCHEKGITVSPAHRRNDTLSAFPGARRTLPGLDEYDSKHCAIPVGWWLKDEDKNAVVAALTEWDNTLG